MLQRAKPVSESGLSRPIDEASAKRFPCLCEYMTQETWGDGTERPTSTVLLVCESGQWKGCVIDNAEDRTMWASAGSLAGVLEALEGRLAKGTAEWRQRKEKGKRR